MSRAALAGAVAITVPALGTSTTPQLIAPRQVWTVAGQGRGTPARDERSVYVLSRAHQLLAIDLHVRPGVVRWAAPLGAGGATMGSRVVLGGDVVVAGDYDLMGFDRRDGRRLWTFAPVDGHGPGVYLGDVSGDLVFAGSAGGRVHAVHVRSGVSAWSAWLGEFGQTTVFAPSIGSHLYVAFSWSAVSASGVSKGGGVAAFEARTGRELWRRRLPSTEGVAGPPLAMRELVLAADHDGRIHALDADTGRLRWSIPALDALEGAPDFRPLAADGPVLVAGSLSGAVEAYDVRTRRTLWRRQPSDASVAFGLSVGGGGVYVPYFSGHVVALRLRDGRELWRIGGRSFGFSWPPLVSEASLFLSGSTGGFFAFQRKLH